MHNTVECHCYKKDRTPTQGTFSKTGRKSGEDRNSKEFHTQVVACMEKLEKSCKKASKRNNKHCHYKESDSVSDSS